MAVQPSLLVRKKCHYIIKKPTHGGTTNTYSSVEMPLFYPASNFKFLSMDQKDKYTFYVAVMLLFHFL